MHSKRKKPPNPREFMILNKLNTRFSLHPVWLLNGILLAICVFSCNKTANINANKSFMAVTHVAYGEVPLLVSFESQNLFQSPLPFGQTSGYNDNPYDTTTTGVRNLALLDGTKVLLQGNTALQQGGHFSMFIYDTLDKNSLAVLILQDNQGNRTDTFTYIRFLNFAPASKLDFLLTRTIDTVLSSVGVDSLIIDSIHTGYKLFVGNNVNPNNYPFQLTHIGYYKAQVSPNDTTYFTLDSLHVDSLKIYNVYLQGFLGDSTSINKLQLKSFPLN